MSSDLIPDDIAQFILKKIDSVAQMEALLLLRANSDQEWDAAAVAKRLYIEEPQASMTLARLLEGKLLIASADEPRRYRYQPSAPELRPLVDRVAEIYSKQLVPVTNLIHSRPQTRVQEFADAFKFRKDD